MHIAIAGNIGSGKTTLTTLLSKHYGWEARFEQVAQNPYMDDYYRDIARWSFPMEVFFLKERFKDLLDIAQQPRDVVQDRTIYEGVYVFTANNYAQGNLSERDFQTYMELFECMTGVVSPPRLLIYLRASVPHLIANIQRRGRDYEQQMPIDYLEGINRRYDEFIYHRYPGRVITIEVDHLDFLHNPADLRLIIDKIDRELYGLF